MKKTICMAAALTMVWATSASATLNFSFTGNFVHDNDVQLFSFTVGASSPNVILRSWSYAGGVNAAGATIRRGGFDPILALFGPGGTYLNQNDDGGVNVAADTNGLHYDTYLNAGSLAAGTYTAAIMQFDNFALGGNLSAGFLHDGVADQNFRNGFAGRDSHWAFDVLNVESSTEVAVPEPSTYIAGALLLLPFGMQGIRSLRSRKQNA